jgi:hypothetical protein
LAEQVLVNFPENHSLPAKIIDLEAAKRYEGEVDLLMTAAVPISAREHRLTGAFVPFHYAPVFATKAFVDLRYAPDSLAAETHHAFDIQKTRSAYAFILKTFYGQDVDPSYHHLIETFDPGTGLSRFYRTELDIQFTRLELTGAKPELSDEEIRELLEDPSNLARYEELLPPDRFEFRGVSIVRAMDATQSEALSRLRQTGRTRNRSPGGLASSWTPGEDQPGHAGYPSREWSDCDSSADLGSGQRVVPY